MTWSVPAGGPAPSCSRRSSIGAAYPFYIVSQSTKISVAVSVRALPAAGAVGVGADHVVEGQHVGVAHGLHGLRVVADGGRVVAEPDLHECLPGEVFIV